MTFELIDCEWEKRLDEPLKANHANIRIVCPFIKCRAANRLLKYGKPKVLQVITRFNLGDFADGVSDISSLRLVLENGQLLGAFAICMPNCTCLEIAARSLPPSISPCCRRRVCRWEW